MAHPQGAADLVKKKIFVSKMYVASRQVYLAGPLNHPHRPPPDQKKMPGRSGVPEGPYVGVPCFPEARSPASAEPTLLTFFEKRILARCGICCIK